MRTSVAALLVGFLVSVVFAVGCAGDEEASQDAQRTHEETTRERTEARAKDTEGKARSGEAVLEMNGDPGIEFSGSCTIGDEETEVSGQVPERFAYDLNGERLDCEIRKESADGNLEVVFVAGPNTRSVQQISGGTLNLTYENGRISSFSSSSSGSGGQVSSSQVVSSSQSSSSSIKISQ